MFGFGKKKPAPTPCPANPGMCAEGKVPFANGSRTWDEAFNVVALAATALKKRGYSLTDEKTWLAHRDSGFTLLPQLVELRPLDDGGVQTLTTMQVNHPALTPAGVFEFQHSTGNTIADSITAGFDQWAQTDFVPLLEALQPKPGQCTAMEMQFPATERAPARSRRAILGPVAHFMQHPPAQPPTDEEHPFCACCLLTRSFEAFKEFVEGDGFYGMRLFAARDADGKPQADCRINGEDWEPGKEALRKYAATWPAAGYEFRKQYVVLQNMN